MFYNPFDQMPQSFLEDANKTYQVFRKGEPLAQVDPKTGDVQIGSIGSDGEPIILGRVNIPFQNSDITIEGVAKQWNAVLGEYPIAVAGMGLDFPVLIPSTEERKYYKGSGSHSIFVPRGEGIMEQVPSSTFVPNVDESLPASFGALLSKGFDEERVSQVLSSLMNNQAFQVKLVSQTKRPSGFFFDEIDRALFDTINDIESSGGDYFQYLKESFHRKVDFGMLDAQVYKDTLNELGLSIELITGAQPNFVFNKRKVIGRYDADAEHNLKVGINPVRSIILKGKDGETINMTAASALSLPKDARVLAEHMLSPETNFSEGVFAIFPGSINSHLLAAANDHEVAVRYFGVEKANTFLSLVHSYDLIIREFATHLKENPTYRMIAKGHSGIPSPLKDDDIPGLTLSNIQKDILSLSTRAAWIYSQAALLMRQVLALDKNGC